MTTKEFELKLCNNGTYYLYKNNDLVVPHIDFDKFNKGSAKNVVDLLNEQHERIQELEKDIETICNDYEKSHGMDIRNAEWFTAW